MREEESQNGITVGLKDSKVKVQYINESNYGDIINILKKYHSLEF